MKYADSGYGLLIYLLLFIVGSIISAAKKKADAAKQKPVVNTNDEETEDSEDPWKEIFEKSYKETDNHKEEIRETYEVKEIPAQPKATPIITKTITPSSSLLATNYNDLIKQSEISNTIEEEVVETNFNIREAVIYSEILNRKYS